MVQGNMRQTFVLGQSNAESSSGERTSKMRCKLPQMNQNDSNLRRYDWVRHQNKQKFHASALRRVTVAIPHFAHPSFPSRVLCSAEARRRASRGAPAAVCPKQSIVKRKVWKHIRDTSRLGIDGRLLTCCVPRPLHRNLR